MKTTAKIITVLGLLAFCSAGLADELLVPAEYLTIQAAINAAVNGDTVLVADGTYTGPGNRDIDFLGKAITVRSESGPENCIIDCNGSEADRHRGFYFHSGEQENSVVDGFTITNGDASTGAGIYCEQSSPKINNCTITNNTSNGWGAGGVHCFQSSPTITNCIISGNLGNIGGGIDCSVDSSPKIINCTITENKGGGIFNYYGSNPTISNCIISGNSANNGGGIWCWDSSPTVNNCLISDNSAHIGGGFFSNIGSPTITNCIITSNLAMPYRGGGIVCMGDGNPTITDCIINGNKSTLSGGGISCESDGNLKIRNCVITGNKSRYGGAIGCFSGSPTITNCTISGNSSEDYGGGIFCMYDTSPTLTNCILWDNAATQGNEIYLALHTSHTGKKYPSTITINYSNVKGGPTEAYVEPDCTLNWGLGNIDTDPCFAFSDDYHLTSNSPCIDTGTNNPVGGLPRVDFDGNVRPLDGDENGSAIADMGIYEFNDEQPTIALSQTEIEFFKVEGGADPNEEILSIRNAGGGVLVWEIQNECDWPETIPASGTSDGEVNDVVLEVNAIGLMHGDYSCELQVIDEQAVNKSQTVLVTLHVNALLKVPQEYKTIQAAIDDAVDGDVVSVAEGTYTGPGNRDIDFLGKAITVRSENGPESCIIDCQGTHRNPHRGFYFDSRENADSIVQGFTITNGYLPWGSLPPQEEAGGAIFCGGFCSPTISNCIITSNQAECGGGIYCNYSSTPTIANCVVSNNKSYGPYASGAGMYFTMRSSPLIRNCTIINNSVQEGYRLRGGGIYSWRANELTISNCILYGNTAHVGPQISISSDGISSNLIVSYSNVQGGAEAIHLSEGCTLNWSLGNIDADPCFVEPGYWADAKDPNIIVEPNDPNAVWVKGNYYLLPDSLCIDAGDPNYIPEPNETDIDGNPRVIGGRIDMGAYESNYIQAAMKFTPQMLNCNSRANWVKAHFVLPEAFLPGDVDANEAAVAEPMGAYSEYIKVIGNDDGPVRLEICFDREAFCETITETGEIEITVIGSLTTSRYFYATDTIKIKPRR